MKKEATSYRLTPEAKQLIKLTSDKLGINETSVLELFIREGAEKRGIQMQFRSRNRVTNESTYHETREQAVDANLTAHSQGGIVQVESQPESGEWSETTEDFEESYRAQLGLSLQDKLRRAGRLPE